MFSPENGPYLVGAAIIAVGVVLAKVIDAAPVCWRWYVSTGENTADVHAAIAE